MRLNLSLSAKMNLIITAAVLIPLIVLGFLSIRTIRNIGVSNLETFVLENGSRRQAAIESDLREALNIINEFIAANEASLNLAIEQQAGGLQDANFELLRDNIQSRMRSQLIETRFYNSVRLLNEVYFPFTTVVRQDQTAPGTLQDQREAVNAIAQRIDLDGGDIQVFGITERNGLERVEVLTALLTQDSAGNTQISGYLLIDLNLDEIFFNNLSRNESTLDTYAFVIIERDGSQIVLAPESVAEAGLIDADSAGTARALANRATTVEIYNVLDAEGNPREVVGYSATLTIDDEAFALIAEVNTSELFTTLTQQATGQIFVVGTVLTVIILIFCLLAANQLILPPIRSVRAAILAMIRGDFDMPVTATERRDELGSLATSFVDMRDYVRQLTDDMNQRLEARTRDVQVTQEIATAVTAERDPHTLMNRVVSLITQNFPSIYHAQIFLIDDESKYAVLRASTGAAGRELLARGHKLGIGSVSVIGQVTEQGQVMIARDTAESNVHRQNEFLGETRAELAIPLRLGNRIIGALDVQSRQRDSFDEDQVSALQTLADQITIAIENTRLYAESERLLAEMEVERGRSTQRAWQQYLYNLRQNEVNITSGAKTGYNFQRLSQAVLQSGEPIVGSPTLRNTIPFVVPVKLRNQTLGVVEYEVPQDDFDYNKVLLAQELVSRLAISLENARLFQASREATERERVVNDISTKLTSQTDIESILQTAVREIELALRTPQVAIRLTGASSNGNGSNGTHHAAANGNDSTLIPDSTQPEDSTQ